MSRGCEEFDERTRKPFVIMPGARFSKYIPKLLALDSKDSRTRSKPAKNKEKEGPKQLQIRRITKGERQRQGQGLEGRFTDSRGITISAYF